MKYSIQLGLVLLILVSSCGSRQNITPAYNRRAPLHKVIAVVPPQTSYTGRLPKDMTLEDAAAIEEVESMAFQKEIYDGLLWQSGPGRKDVSINFQALNKTNQLLADSGYSIRDSWNLSPEKLCELLKVDAVVRGDLQMQRFMSGLESYGLDVADDVLDILRTKIPGGDQVPLPTDNFNMNRTYDIAASLQVLDGRDGVVLWGVSNRTQADWEFTPQQMVQGLSRQFARRFPYRFN